VRIDNDKAGRAVEEVEGLLGAVRYAQVVSSQLRSWVSKQESDRFLLFLLSSLSKLPQPQETRLDRRE
jgi:hypothetical protein